jgi:hypothetical protein
MKTPNLTNRYLISVRRDEAADGEIVASCDRKGYRVTLARVRANHPGKQIWVEDREMKSQRQVS